MSLKIRNAQREDAAQLIKFVKDLAIYEKEPASAMATVEDFERYGFGPDKIFNAVIAEWEGKPVGFALYFFQFSTWTGQPSLYLEDLFVDPQSRGKGIGKALLVHLARIAVEKNCARYQWQVLDWNKPAIDFYEMLGAKATKEWIPFRVEGDALRKLAALK